MSLDVGEVQQQQGMGVGVPAVLYRSLGAASDERQLQEHGGEEGHEVMCAGAGEGCSCKLVLGTREGVGATGDEHWLQSGNGRPEACKEWVAGQGVLGVTVTCRGSWRVQGLCRAMKKKPRGVGPRMSGAGHGWWACSEKAGSWAFVAASTRPALESRPAGRLMQRWAWATSWAYARGPGESGLAQ